MSVSSYSVLGVLCYSYAVVQGIQCGKAGHQERGQRTE
eukprot:COSAG01_NODE_71196_length_256_cov_1.324841_1_plen_37_part_01